MVYKSFEISHTVVEPLLTKSDQELLALFQAYPDSGRYLVAIFCRYGQITYALTHEVERSPAQADYLFVKTWERIYQELKLLKLETNKPVQNFLIDITGTVISSYDPSHFQSMETSVNAKYHLSVTSPIFLCYLNQALDQLSFELRLVLTLSEVFNWSSSRIAAYLNSEGDRHKVKDIDELRSKANLALVELLPKDIQEIYLSDTHL